LVEGARIPKFENEEQEARWWDERKTQVERNLSAGQC